MISYHTIVYYVTAAGRAAGDDRFGRGRAHVYPHQGEATVNIIMIISIIITIIIIIIMSSSSSSSSICIIIIVTTWIKECILHICTVLWDNTDACCAPNRYNM